MMKIISLFALLVSSLVGYFFAQEVIENPERPKNQRGGREVVLEEVMRITDDGGEFYFVGPRDLKVDSDG